MKFIPEMKRKNKVNSKHETRQRLRMLAILRIGTVTVVLLILGLTLFFQLTNSDRMQADNKPAATWVIVAEQEYVTETTLAQPVITHEEIGAQTCQYRKVKPTVPTH